MRHLIQMAVVSSILAYGCSSPSSPKKRAGEVWGNASVPTVLKQGQSSQSIGSYSAGCIDGAVSLPPDGIGYQMMRITRKRFYGHPTLVRFIEDFGKKMHARARIHDVALIGDLGQARGGPSLSGHRSHQTGLDVDIWFWAPESASVRSLTLDEREQVFAPSMVKISAAHPIDGQVDASLWTSRQIEMLKTAALHDSVDRIFVHPIIKRELCVKVMKEREWLQKIRPWWGHNHHFHVRLKCPSGQVECNGQEALPKGDGCDGTLNWWFSPEAKEVAMKQSAEAPPADVTLPMSCLNVLNQ